jgi:hypothetical protein
LREGKILAPEGRSDFEIPAGIKILKMKDDPTISMKTEGRKKHQQKSPGCRLKGASLAMSLNEN